MRHLPWAPGEQLPASPCLLTCLLCSRYAGLLCSRCAGLLCPLRGAVQGLGCRLLQALDCGCEGGKGGLEAHASCGTPGRHSVAR